MEPVDRTEALSRLETGRVGRLSTIRPDGLPHVVPITYASLGEAVVTMIDHKPKTTMRLQRLVNVEANPMVSLVVDHWSEEWTELWWVRVDGTGLVHRDDDVWREARMVLVAKYPQYRERPPEGPAIVISIDHLSSWQGTG